MRLVAAALFLALAAAFMMAAPPAGAMSCKDVNPTVHECADYVTGTSPEPSATCCDGVRRLHDAAVTVGERRTICHCIKIAGAHIRTLNDELVGALPDACSVQLPYRLSLKNNCNTIP